MLDEAEVLEEEEEQELREEIEKLAEETEHTPLTHEKWETVDALREKMRLRLETASLTVSKARDAAATLAAAGLGDGQKLSMEQTMQLEKQAIETLRKLAENGEFSKLSSQARSELQRLIKDGKFSSDPAERQKQLEALEEFLDQEADRLSECREKCDGGACPRCGSGQCQGEGNCPGVDGDGRPGRGGINRGRGDAPITWGDESDEQGVKFKETVLPPGLLDDPKNEVIGINPTAPEVAPADSAPRAAARAGDPSAGRETWNRRLRPRHRRVVRNYFDTE